MPLCPAVRKQPKNPRHLLGQRLSITSAFLLYRVVVRSAPAWGFFIPAIPVKPPADGLGHRKPSPAVELFLCQPDWLVGRFPS